MKEDISPVFSLHVTNVHHGDGATLLRALLGTRLPHLTVYARLDTRMALPPGMIENSTIRRVRLRYGNGLLCALVGLNATNAMAQLGVIPRQLLIHFGMIVIAVIGISVLQPKGKK